MNMKSAPKEEEVYKVREGLLVWGDKQPTP